MTLDSEVELNAAIKEYETLKASAEKQASLVSSLNADLVAYNALIAISRRPTSLPEPATTLEGDCGGGGTGASSRPPDGLAVPGEDPYRPRKALTILLALASALAWARR
ncbi:MAG: hypothetical protein R2748_04710 [Bryobacterales bacterium]